MLQNFLYLLGFKGIDPGRNGLKLILELTHHTQSSIIWCLILTCHRKHTRFVEGFLCKSLFSFLHGVEITYHILSSLFLKILELIDEIISLSKRWTWCNVSLMRLNHWTADLYVLIVDLRFPINWLHVDFGPTSFVPRYLWNVWELTWAYRMIDSG